jgi:cell division protein FtsB
MSKKRVSHAREVFYIICIVIFLLIGLFTYVGPGGYMEMKRVQAELATHQERVEAQKQTKADRLKSIESLRDDRQNDEEIERYLRERGYGRKGEIIQEVPKPDPGRTPPKGK